MKKLLFLSIILLPLFSYSQDLRSSYFMKSSTVRLDMNPAFQPDKGFAKIIGLGGIGTNFSSNSLTLDKFIYSNPDGKGGCVSVLDSRIDGDKFINSLEDKNKFNISFRGDLLGFGWFTKKQNFWSINLGIKSMFNGTLPRSFFDFLKNGNSGETGIGNTYDFKNLQASEISYADLSIGYSRNINSKLIVGVKVKYLKPIADVNMKFDNLKIELKDDYWRAEGTGDFHAIGRNMEAEYEMRDGKETIDDLNFDGNNSSIGSGMGIDLGAEYLINEKIKASFSIIDLGKLHYKKESDIAGTANTDYSFSGINLNENETFDLNDVISYEKAESEKRTRSLPTAINCGIEYKVLGDKLTAGLLYSSRDYDENSIKELTLSGNYHPYSWLYATASYSFIESETGTMGLALNLCPSWINFFVGTDFMFFKVTPQFVPVKNNVANLFMGISIPLGKKNRKI